jgi:hypothetical protein
MRLGLPPTPTTVELEKQQERRDSAAAADAEVARNILRRKVDASNENFELGQATRVERMASGENERQNKRKERSAAESATAKKSRTRDASDSDDDDDDDDDEEKEEQEGGEKGDCDEENEWK